MAFEIPDHYSKSFTTNVELLLQQTDSRFEAHVTMGSYTGEAAQVVKQFGEVEFQEKASRLEPTNLQEIEHRQRWVFPVDRDCALPVEREDEIRMLNSPTSPYVMAMTAAWNRKKDSVLSAAALGTAKTGVNGGTSTAFDAANFRVAADFAINGAPLISGLTLAKISEAKRLLDAAECPEEDRVFATTSTGIQDLVNTTEVLSSDYNTVRALNDGKPGKLHGFNIIRYEGLGIASGVRSNVAWHKSGLHMGKWNELNTDIGPRRDLKNVTQILMKGTIGATRTNEEKVVEVLCSEV